MSKSYRKPYCTITGKRSAADDKRFARRSWRRAQNQALRELGLENYDEFLIPARYEASGNDVWGWGRDGKQRPCPPPTWEQHLYWFNCNYFDTEESIQHALEYFERSKKYYEYLKRK